MVNESAKTPVGTDKSEIAASAACTRSGAFALLLTIVLFLLAHIGPNVERTLRSDNTLLSDLI